MKIRKYSFRLLLGVLHLSLLSVGLALGEAQLPSREDAIQQLLTEYRKNASHLARYESKRDDKSLSCTLVSDQLSGLAALQTTVTKGDARAEMRMWTTDDDRLYMSVNGESTVTRGLREESSAIDALGKHFFPDSFQGIQSHASILLTTDSVEAAAGFLSASSAPWKSSLKEASVDSMNEDIITFATQEHGLLSISRKTGMLERQLIKGADGKDRILELKEFKREPGRKVIEEMTRDWSTLGAENAKVGNLTMPLRLALFQGIITSVESGASDLGKLETMLGEQRDRLRHLAELCAADDVDSQLAQHFRRVPLAGKDKIRQAWIKDLGGKADDEMGFQNLLTSREFRQDYFDRFMKMAGQDPDYTNKIITLLLGKGVWEQVKTTDESGSAAKDLCGKAIALACIELQLEHRMNQEWGRPDALD